MSMQNTCVYYAASSGKSTDNSRLSTLVATVAGMTVQQVHSALLAVGQTIREHATTSIQMKADDYRKQAAQRSAKYTACQPTSANRNDEDDEEDAESEGIFRSFSKLQHRQLAKLQICALKADADVAAAKAVAQELSQPVTTQFIDQPDSVLEDGEELHTKLEPQLTLALSLCPDSGLLMRQMSSSAI